MYGFGTLLLMLAVPFVVWYVQAGFSVVRWVYRDNCRRYPALWARDSRLRRFVAF